MTEVQNFTSAADMQEYWIKNIAPNYFDFSDTNNYRVGVFGYINEIMSNITIDTHKAMQFSRRESHPITAQNPQSLYKMAAIQKIGPPLTTAGTCKAVLYISQDEVIANSVYKDGIYTCIIDNTMKIMADNIPFVIDYPIVIISKKSNNVWKHTIHYDTSITNSLSTLSNTYIINKVTNQDGKKYILMAVTLRQLERTVISQLITKDSVVDTISMMFPFEGNLANFEAYYTADPESNNSVRLEKLPFGSPIPKIPFYYYRLLNDNLLQLTFPKNIYFTPLLNSEIELNVFTSLGVDGNFKTFAGSLVCSLQSEKYAYNNNMTVMGNTNGSCDGGKAKPTKEEYRNIILDAFSTNNTITTTNDLQRYFNKLSNDPNNRIRFKKKRDDAFIRLYEAYCLLKDNAGNVVPTNDLTLELQTSDYDVYSEATTRGFIRPGCLFEYLPNTEEIIYRAKKVTDLTIVDNLDTYDDNSRFIFTNPFLIAVTMNPNIVGFYYNALDEIKAIEYSYINDSTLMQFIGSSLKVYRNPIAKANFYKLSLTISPATELDSKTIVTVNTSSDEANVIRATKNGTVISLLYVTDHVVCQVKYDDNTTQSIDVSSYITKNTSTGEFTYNTGYNMNFNVYDRFIANDILATKKVTDLGKIRVALDFDTVLLANNLYIPMVIEDYDPTLNTYTVAGYISTDDSLSLDSKMLIEHGIFDATGVEDANVSIPMNNLSTSISIFYKNADTNYSHKYSSFDFFSKHSLTNTYSGNKDDHLALVQQIDFIRSTVVFEETIDPNVFNIVLKEVPVAKANWVKDFDNFSYLTNAIYSNYEKLYATYFLLENNFGIDLKFFNTYGKSRFYKVGVKTTTSVLAYVNCSFKFGVSLTSISNQDLFIERFRSYIKDYVESINSTDSSQSIYIMNLISSLKTEFSEIGFIEYYGFNNYEYSAQKIIPIDNDDLTSVQKSEYIPEFINIYSYKKDGVLVPQIEVTILTDSI
jgi:hypothetical protein